ncbi:hypothetical protein Ae201684P_010407 [Aphanomyces euteiches]|nr:hypothetical protein Ae201684P_010407 [Aphanomyces euteiches]
MERRPQTRATSTSPSRGSPRKAVSSVKELKATVPDVPLDFSFMNLPTVSETTSSPRGDSPCAFESPVSIRLNNNCLTHLEDLDKALATVFIKPSRLQWIDLSGNALTSIPQSVFLPYLGLTTVHLHANQLAKYSDIDSLICLTKLRHLTLHGNPVEEKKHYRNYTIFHLPSLLELDFSSITRIDRERAATWSITYRKTLARRRGELVDDDF